MTSLRAGLATMAVVVALILQVTFFPHFAIDGVVPNLCLLVVVGAALARGPQFAMVLGFAAGVALDLAPPADHLAGRWALALMIVGYVAGRIRADVRHTPVSVLATVAASSFVGTSVFALSGVLLSDPAMGIGHLLSVVLVALILDLILAPFVLPTMLAAFRWIEPDRERVRI